MSKPLQAFIAITAALSAFNAYAATFTFRNATNKQLELEVRLKYSVMGLKRKTEVHTILPDGEVQIKHLGWCLDGQKAVRIALPEQRYRTAQWVPVTPDEREKVQQAYDNLENALAQAGKGIGDAISGISNYGNVLSIASDIGNFLYTTVSVPDECRSQHFEIIINYDAQNFDTPVWIPYLTYLKY